MGSALGLLAQLDNPADLRRLPPSRLPALAAEIRQFLVDKVSRTGGHLGPNLGVVELTIAVHRVFNSPKDRIIFDTGHQAYVHKLLTGRRAGFDQLRQRGGLAGYPMRAESEHDLVENSHASTALSYADGLAKAYALSGQRRRVVAVVGDGALTGGMSWEALNNVASARDRQVIVVVNDNGRSYSPTIGGLAEHLSALRLSREYEQVLALVKDALSRTPLVGSATFEVLHGVKRGLKDVLAPQGLFEDLGLKYVGPVNGHDVAAVESALRQAKAFGGPVLVHCVTRKGHGYRPAEEDEADCLHGPGAFDPATGKPLAAPRATWTSVFSEELVRIGRRRPDVVAITAAMLRPTGLAPFAAAFPERVFDVGIAEQHGVTSAAGLAMGGMHPVVAVYSTFMNRAFDQVLMDVALHRLPVTFVLDRSGITGDDGPSHHGMWDLALFGIVPGLRIAAPRDGTTLRTLLGEAVADATGPTMVRFPKGSVPGKVPAHESTGGVDVLRRDERSEVLLVSVGAMAQLCLDAAARVAAEGIAVTVVDPRWVQPVPEALLELARGHRFVVTVEDGVRTGGFGSRLSQALRDAECDVALREIGLSSAFLAHGTREQVLAEQGISAQSVARQVVEWVSRLQEASELRASGMEPELA